MKVNLKYAERFMEVRDPVRASTRAPGPDLVAALETPFQISQETAIFLKTVTRGASSAMSAALTWVVAAYLRKVGRGDAVVLTVPAPGEPGRWIPFRCDISLEEPAKASLVRVRDALQDVSRGGALDLEEVAGELALAVWERDNGLSDTAVHLLDSYQTAPFPPSIALGIRFQDDQEGLRGYLHWRPDCFDPRDVQGIPGHLEALLGILSRDMSIPLAGLSLLGAAEKARLVEEPNRTETPLPGPASIPAAFAQIAAGSGNETAVIVGEKHMTYADLEVRADRVAAALLTGGVAPGSRVGLMARRDEWLLPSLLGILKAGCAYVPLDPEYPEDRIRWVLEDCQASALVASSGVLLPEGAPATFILEELPDPGPGEARFPRVSPADAAYLIYTSGSTGKPKGVRITHGNVINFFAGMDAVLPRTPRDTWLAVTSISFDISVLELLWTACRGVRAVIQEDGRLVESESSGSRDGAGPTFSLFFFADCDAEEAPAQYDLLFRAAEFADREGMESVWVPERHFHRFGGLFPNPSLAAAALAARTRRIGIRAGSVVSPLHNPLRIAEEWSFVDNISGGRVGISFASGWNPRDFVLAPAAFPERRQSVYQDLDFVRRFWRGESMTLPGGNGSHEVKLYPRPVQRELPVWVTASDSIETFARAGALGANILTHLLHHSLDALQAKIEAYRAAWRENHGEATMGKVTLMAHTFVGDSARSVLDVVREPFLRYLRSSTELMRAALPPELSGAPLGEGDREAMVEAAFGRFFEERGLFGTPETCLEKVRRLQDAGVDEIACLVDFIPDQGLVYDHLRHLARLQSLARGRGVRRDVAGQIEAHRVTHFQCTPSLARALMESRRFQESLRHLKAFAIGGEAFPSGLQNSIREFSDTAVLNMYGPTETTVWSTVHRLEDASGDIPIGWPIANTRIYVLAPDLSPLPANRPGELYIGGRGVAAGYWNRDDLTAERFIRDPFSPDPLARLYRTGDLVQWDHEGQIRFLGRLDRQIKIRGHRIELGEIENRMRAFPGIREALVVSRKIRNSVHLCAYFRSDAAVGMDSLKDALSAAMPAYMVPEFLIRVDAFPMTPNRKIDIHALPDPGEEGGAPVPAAGPSNPVQADLLGIWKRVLGKETLGIHDDFFRSGGDSIQAIQVAAQTNAAGFSMSPKLLYEHPTIAALARIISRDSTAPPFHALPADSFALLPAQKWFFRMEVPDRNHWNQSLLLGLRGEVPEAPLRAAVESAFARHPAFRVRFRKEAEGAEWSQAYDLTESPPVLYRRETWKPGDPAAEDWIESRADQAHRSLNIGRGPLAAVLHLSGIPGGEILLLSAHHLVVDGVSWRMLLEDIERAYAALLSGRGAGLPPAPGPHLLVSLSKEQAASPAGRAAEAFWKEKLARSPGPVWDGSTAYREDECESLVTIAGGFGAREIAHSASRLRADAETLALAALVRSLRLAGIGSGFSVDMESHGRSAGSAFAGEDASGTQAIGWMTRIFPLEVPPGSDSPEEALAQVKAVLREAGLHRDFFGAVPGTEDGTRPSGQIIFNYLGRFDALTRESALFASIGLSPGRPRDPGAVRHHVLEVNVHQSGDGLTWEFIFPPALLPREAMKRLAGYCTESLAALSGLSPEAAAACLLPEDFPGTGLRADEIRELASRPEELEDVQEATTHQRAIFFQLHACPSDRSRFVHQALLAVEGTLDEDRLEQALQGVVARHGAFRSAFVQSRTGILLQTIWRTAAMPVRKMDWSAHTSGQREARLAILRRLDLEQGFPTESAPLARAVLVRTAPDSRLLLFTYHHLIADGWSLPLVMRDLRKAYAKGQVSSHLQGDYGLFARWLKGRDRRQEEAFWTQYLEGIPPPALLSPSGRKSDFSYRVEYAILNETVPEESVARWERMARGEGTTLPILLQVAWGLALCRASRSPESSFGITVAGRPAEIPGIENTVGLFINSVPFRFHPSEDDTPPLLLRKAHAEGADLREHSQVEPSFLGRLLGLQGGQMAFETVLVIQSFRGVASAEDSEGFRLEAMDFVERNPAPLTLEAVPGKTLSLRYVSDLRHFQPAQVRELHLALLAALDDLVRHPTRPVRLLPSVHMRETVADGRD